jgi:hypothetical protein
MLRAGTPTRRETRGPLCAAFTDPQGRGEPRWRPEPPDTKLGFSSRRKPSGRRSRFLEGLAQPPSRYLIAVLGDHTIHTNQSGRTWGRRENLSSVDRSRLGKAVRSRKSMTEVEDGACRAGVQTAVIDYYDRFKEACFQNIRFGFSPPRRSRFAAAGNGSTRVQFGVTSIATAGLPGPRTPRRDHGRTPWPP